VTALYLAPWEESERLCVDLSAHSCVVARQHIFLRPALFCQQNVTNHECGLIHIAHGNVMFV